MLASRAKMKTGEAGSKGKARHSFCEAATCEAARIGANKFGWPPEDLQRVIKLIRSGDEDAVRDATVAVFRGHVPGTSVVDFFAPGELARGTMLGTLVARAEKEGVVLQKVSLLKIVEIVETVANGLYEKMKRAGFEFSGVVDGPKPKRRKRKRN